MPAGPAGTEGAVPDGLALFGRLPQHEVLRIFLVRGYFHTRAGDHIVERASRQFAVLLIRLNRKQHVTFRRIGEAVGDQPVDEGDDVRHRAGGRGLERLGQDVQRRSVFVINPSKTVGYDVNADAVLSRRLIDLVVHVGEVARKQDLVRAIAMTQQTEQHVEHDFRTEIPDMGGRIDRRPADIHRHPIFIDGDEGALFARSGVIEHKVGHHGAFTYAGDRRPRVCGPG